MNNTASVRIAMKITDMTDKAVAIEMTHKQALMIRALIRETCSGTPMDEFDTRVGYQLEVVKKLGSELQELLDEVEISDILYVVDISE